ncbi:YdcF family protein [Acinetobacter sp. ANC 4648]|uniref:YdcF family protein n=1 Tax=Acinetobacter sp. ANC 4648 TaxID=1977875 RepID=UPI000A333517|nr:YdcF family protein [Acinetobacter sp. ANC 4648]OTG82921.1 hypothetical protein B9T27_06525 [Acinetobacter sp. ANC 4648]
MQKMHWMVKLVRIAAILFVLLACLVVFWYTPFYSNLIVKVLNQFVPVEVNRIAAKSQQMASLTDTEDLEPGSDEWIARQAYLSVIEDAIKHQDSQELALIQARYKVLQADIQKEQAEEDEQQEKPQIPLMLKPETATSEVQSAFTKIDVSELLGGNNNDDKALMEKYVHFLKSYEITESAEQLSVDQQVYKDIALLQNQNEDKKRTLSQPYAIVVVGGGLTLDKNQKDIIVNDYTKLRLETTLKIEKSTKLPIVLSGVEAPYMQKWLNARGVDANLLENRSMNTCENTRFSSLLLQKKGGAPTVLLVTDRYHMPRTRRLFALNGVETIAVEAPMPTQLTDWKPSKLNYDHSRRANYELLATIRDVLFGTSGCREVP